jgi:hypothetical protein
MLTVAIPTAEVSRNGKRRSLSSATTRADSLQKSVTLAGKSWLKTRYGPSTQRRGGDYILIGASTDAAPPDEADEIRQIVQFADTFERLADDFALITGV